MEQPTDEDEEAGRISEGKKEKLFVTQGKREIMSQIDFQSHSFGFFHHTMDISLDSFLCFPFYFILRHITHTRASLDFSFNDSAYSTLFKWSEWKSDYV